MRGRYPFAMLFVLLACGCVGPGVHRHRRESFTVPAATREGTREVTLLICTPRGYDDPERADERWPLVVYLPGLFAEGHDPAYVTRAGLASLLEKGLDVPAVVASPQMHSFAVQWEPRHVRALLEHVEREYRIDSDRIVLTGVSLGGVGAWDVAKAMPERFSALVPVAAFTSADGVERLRDVPVWSFHGQLDFAMPYALASQALAAHRAAGGETHVTILPWAFHWIWSDVYHDRELWRWALSRRRTHSPWSTTGARVEQNHCR